MEKMTIAEKIGDEYMQWEPHSKVFISAPTGSGKTYFVLHKLLPYVSQKKQRILYLVNRTILKEQLEREISLLPSDLRWGVRIVLYQTIENYILYKRVQELEKLINEFDYVVCDECHYFLADSNYNTNTCLSFGWVQEYFRNKIRVFMSATIENIRAYIGGEDENAKFQRTQIYSLCSKYSISQRLFPGRVWEYTLERCYDYLNIKIITTRDRVIDLVCDGSEKWLIFVDSITFGKELYKKIKKKFRELYRSQKGIDEDCKEYKKDVVFLSAGYKKVGGDAAEEMQAIKNDSVQSARILIATSVMDNGVSLKDDRLNNVIVFADNETEFIQMLGRKRESGNQVNLYIFKWGKEHFDRRRDQLIRNEKVASDYKESLYSQNIIVEELSGQGIDWKKSNQNEMSFCRNQNIWLLNRLMNEENIYDKIKMTFFAWGGLLFLNLLSVYQMDRLKGFYIDIIEKFSREGEDAFVREQLRWLGKGEIEIEEMIEQSKITEETKLRREICAMIDGILGSPMTRAKALDFKNEIRNKLRTLVHFCQNSNDRQTVEKNLGKTDRPISKPDVEFLRKNCKLPYMVEVKSSKEDGETYYTFKPAAM